MASRVALPADLAAITRTIALAFTDDPVWGPAFGTGRTTLAERETIWRGLVAAALREPWSRVVDDGAAVSVWIAPGVPELTADEELELGRVLDERLGPAAAEEVHALMERFAIHHPPVPEHAYLSLLATHPDHRGRGLGMALLSDDLRRLDALHVPAWLESTNPANDGRYRSVGFETVGSFETIDGRHAITTMWRPAR